MAIIMLSTTGCVEVPLKSLCHIMAQPKSSLQKLLAQSVSALPSNHTSVIESAMTHVIMKETATSHKGYKAIEPRPQKVVLLLCQVFAGGSVNFAGPAPVCSYFS